MWFRGPTSISIRLKYKTVNMNLTTACYSTPNSVWCPIYQILHPSHLRWVWLFCRWFPQPSIKVPTHIIRVYYEKDFLFWCSYSAFNKNFPQYPCLICVKWFILILPRSLFMPIVLRNCFRIFALSISYLFVYISSTSVLFWNFLIYHLGVRVPVPDKRVFLRSSLIRFNKYM